MLLIDLHLKLHFHLYLSTWNSSSVKKATSNFAIALYFSHIAQELQKLVSLAYESPLLAKAISEITFRGIFMVIFSNKFEFIFNFLCLCLYPLLHVNIIYHLVIIVYSWNFVGKSFQWLYINSFSYWYNTFLLIII